MEQLCDIFKEFNMQVCVQVNPYCGCLHDNLCLNFSKMCPKEQMKWFKSLQCRMISNAINDKMTAGQIGLLAAGLIMINPKKFFDQMKDEMTGKEIENLLIKQLDQTDINNCAFGKK